MKEAKKSGDYDEFLRTHDLEEKEQYSFLKTNSLPSSPSTSSIGEGSEFGFDAASCFTEVISKLNENASDNQALLNNKYLKTKRSKPNPDVIRASILQ
jgi:hypothetical protein